MITKKKAIAIIGSYRKRGVVDSVISGMISILEEKGVECQAIYLNDYNIEFCTNCRCCLQTPGVERGQCIHKDDMETILTLIDHADYLIIGSPTNAGNATALTRRFLERCVCFSYWPWGAPSPVLRNKEKTKRSILVSASAAPALIGRYFNGTLKALKTLSEFLGAKPVGYIWVGGVTTKTIVISDKIKTKARKLVERLVK
jgi:hypothetical protein